MMNDVGDRSGSFGPFLLEKNCTKHRDFTFLLSVETISVI